MFGLRNIKIIPHRLAHLTLLIGLSIPLTARAVDGDQLFDFQHIRGALDYFENPSPKAVANIAFTDAAAHLERHSQKTGYYPKGSSRLKITQNLLENKPDAHLLSTAKALMARYANDRRHQARCYTDAQKMLPPNSMNNGRETQLYVTWGYDIGVAMDGSASLNMVHPKFIQNPDEFWYTCIHELHHAGVMALHPFPFVIEDITNTAELMALVDYSTFIEGTAVWAAYEARANDGTLDNDNDYVVLDSPILMAGILADYQTQRQKLTGPIRAVEDADWDIINAMSSGDRLWYRVGAHMARQIDQQSGRDVLLQAIAGGSGAFFAAYADSSKILDLGQ